MQPDSAAQREESVPLGELTPEELKMLGHALRFVPDNAIVGPGLTFVWQDDDFKSLWEKVAHAVNTREDMAIYRTKPIDGPTPEEEAMGDHPDAPPIYPEEVEVDV